MSVLLGINEMKEISNAMTLKTGYPFDDFLQSFLKRRLTIYLEKFHIRQLEQFIKQLGSKLFLESLLYYLPVVTTEMFRDPGFWRSLKSNVLNNNVIQNNPVWFPDIASGEELYSFLIFLELTNADFRPEVFFHHPSSSRIDEVKSGIIRSKNIETYSNNFKRLELGGQFETYCKMENNYMVVAENLISKLNPKKGWFLTEPLTQGFGLIFFRNTMLYMNKNLHEKTIQFLFNMLIPGGYLVIGVKERIPDSITGKFQVIDEQEGIYRKPVLNNTLL